MAEDALVYIGTLVLLPTLLYTLVFWIHFSLLQTYTPHADNMGSAYSASLSGWALRSQPAHIHSSSFVTIRAAAYPFEYLCSKQYADSANSTAAITWLSSTRTFAIQDYLQVNLLDRERLLEAGGGTLADGSLVSLQAPKTDLYISVFPVYRTIDSRGLYVDFAEQNTSNTKVAAFGATRSVATKATAATWRIKEVAKRADGNASGAREIMPIASRFRLVSPDNNNCELSISRSQPLQATAERRAAFLPEYSLECVPKGGVTWTIEHQIARSDRPMAEIPPHAVKPSLLTTTVTYNLLMREINGMLKSDPDQHVPVESAPASWPFLKRPLRMVGAWADETQPKYLLVGNFLVWWVAGFVCTFVHPTLVCLHWVISKRSGGRVLLLLPEDSRKTSMLWVLWAAHYLVFFGMSRTTYLHHYLPALYFAVILAALYVYRLAESAGDVLLTAVSGPFTPRQSACCKRNVLAAFVVAAVVVSWLLAPVTFGTYKPCSFRILRYISALDQQLC
ncbi:Protein O-mannosyltransferase 2 [Coemansia sp. BCRC 34490]|nr:Protein O-mannosyltransferase 2 [Coemansia sp. BCRC 34490]